MDVAPHPHIGAQIPPLRVGEQTERARSRAGQAAVTRGPGGGWAASPSAPSRRLS
jgi:hypothetical protein